jgi:hypothetical protein
MKQQLLIVFALFISLFIQPSTVHGAFPLMETAPVAAEHTGFREKVQDAIKQYSTPAPAESRRRTDDGWMGITSLTLGIAGGALMIAALVSASLSGLFALGILAAIMAIIFGAMGLKSSRKGLATAGMVLGIVEVVLLVAIVALAVVALSTLK